MAEIRVENLRKQFGSFVAVQDSSFVVEDGEFFCLLGPSGCGKTTTLAHDRRPRAADQRDRSGSTARTSPSSAPRARHRLRLPALCALPAHERAQEHLLPAGSQGMPKAEIEAAGGGDRALLRSSISSTSRSPGLPAATGSAWRSAAPSCASRKAS
jgi:multiple sugar transport system ATP-binding protein